MSKSQLGKLLTGKVRPSVKSLRVLAGVLGKSLDETWAELKPAVKPKGKRKRREK
jgi:transcriptional regulator with XRE-family HTH domain